jgi:hypothetical protein
MPHGARREVGSQTRDKPDQILRYPLGDALRTSEEPQNPQWLRAFTDYALVSSAFKIENVRIDLPSRWTSCSTIGVPSSPCLSCLPHLSALGR